MSEPWYQQGLKFSCTGCGDCCTGAPGYVWVTKAEIAALAAALSLPVEEFERQFVRSVGMRKSLVEFDGGDCALFDGETRQCRVYDARPRQCRTWPFWASNLSSTAAWEATAERCPGCNRGRRVPLGKILAQLEMVRV
jgi:Fe-S-cluster containining protein